MALHLINSKKRLHYKGIGYWAPNNRVFASHFHKRLYTLGADVDRRRERMIKEKKGIMDIEREFPLFPVEIMRLRIYSLESSESRCASVSFFLCFLLLLQA